MRLHRFIGEFDLSQNNIEIKDTELISQALKVLRLKAGDEFIISDGKSNEATAKITEIQKSSIKAEIIKKYKNQNEPKNKAYLYCAILKRENFELVVQKATETGIFEIVPIITERTIKTGLNMDRLRKIIKEAAEQSGRGIIPRLHQPMDFKAVLEHAKLNDLNIIFHPAGTSSNFLVGRDPHPGTGGRAQREKITGGVGLFIGPEGGFRENEIRFAKENNFEIASLGQLTLRAETAAIIASYLSVNK